MRSARLLPVGLLLLGVALIGYSLATGQATLGLLVVIPFVVGSSWTFAVGVLALAAGFFTLPFLFGADEAWDDRPSTGAGSSGSGGVLLIGPIPIFFGAYRHPPGWVYFLAASVGVLLVVLAVLLLVLR